MSRLGLHRSVTGLLALLLVAGCDNGPTPPGAGVVSHVPGDLVMERLDGPAEAIERYRGRVVVLNAWATWCAPCRAELPGLQRLADDLGTTDFAVIGLSIDENPALAGEFLRDRHITFARHIDRGGRILKERLGLSSVPLSIVLGRDGKVLWSATGLREWGDPAVAIWLRGLK